MRTKLAGNQDVFAGLIYVVIGIIGFVIAMGYKLGNAVEMGPGYFPRILSALLVVFGLVIMARGLRNRIGIDKIWAWRSLLLLSLAIVLFGATLEPLGLVPAVSILILVAAYAGHEFKLPEVLGLMAIMSLFAAIVFVWGLKLPYPLFAWSF